MNGRTNIEVGLAGSLTMIFLTTAVVLLLVSFYRRYKRMSDRFTGSHESNESNANQKNEDK